MSCDPQKLVQQQLWCATEVTPAHCHHTCVTGRDRAPQCWLWQVRVCCHSLQPHRAVQGMSLGQHRAVFLSQPLGSGQAEPGTPQQALAPWVGTWVAPDSAQHHCPSTARALQWVALPSPESWLTEVLPSGMPVLVSPWLLCLSLLAQPHTGAGTELQ